MPIHLLIHSFFHIPIYISLHLFISPSAHPISTSILPFLHKSTYSPIHPLIPPIHSLFIIHPSIYLHTYPFILVTFCLQTGAGSVCQCCLDKKSSWLQDSTWQPWLCDYPWADWRRIQCSGAWGKTWRLRLSMGCSTYYYFTFHNCVATGYFQ